jgi:hypothetical protein
MLGKRIPPQVGKALADLVVLYRVSCLWRGCGVPVEAHGIVLYANSRGLAPLRSIVITEVGVRAFAFKTLTGVPSIAFL